MEPVIRTRFPVARSVGTQEVSKIFADWISLNRNFNLNFPNKETIIKQLINDEYLLKETNSGLIEKTTAVSGGQENLAICFAHPISEGRDIFYTKLGFYNNKNGNAEIGVSLEKTSTHRFSNQIEIRKPVLITKLIENLPMHHDSGIPIQISPHLPQQEDAPFVADYFIGAIGNILPILYVSRTHENNATLIDPLFLASKASGLAHVFVEPNQQFGREIAKNFGIPVSYDGAIKLYWPTLKTQGGYLWTKKLFNEQDFNQEEITSEIVSYIASRTRGMPMGNCSDSIIKNIYARNKLGKRISEMQKQGTEGQAMIQLYEQEIQRLEETTQRQEFQVEELSEKLTSTETDNQVLRESLRTIGQHRLEHRVDANIASNEGILSAINSYLTNTNIMVSPYQKERLQSFLNANTQTLNRAQNEQEEEQEEIARAFKSYNGLNAHCRQMLQKFGYDFSEEGPHYKVFKKDLPGITMTVAKTPSDHRSGENIVRDFRATFWRI
jgi:hypothetical protein